MVSPRLFDASYFRGYCEGTVTSCARKTELEILTSPEAEEKRRKYLRRQQDKQQKITHGEEEEEDDEPDEEYYRHYRLQPQDMCAMLTRFICRPLFFCVAKSQILCDLTLMFDDTLGDENLRPNYMFTP
ncbi:hypothetical protein PAXRUDRAFT_428307 [Paxillus rubicundulus Ve08.2h10]|uniref:Uncharacterized protein n=1 Tax=Paxillus rubicundulus Ve08.2h10 TaxID=930991 RepID=A0A0D0DC15_9AGAM|nr:hypothetical protein PAXRUDRAFT_428307 [Paxillus rubicundulus Ve08.2h10]